MASAEQGSSWVFDLSGGELSLNFANTVGGNRLTRPVERLNNYADLVSFGRQVGILSPERARRLLEQSEKHPKKAAAVLAQARELREAIYRIWMEVLHQRTPAAGDLGLLNALLSKGLAQQRLAHRGERFILQWADENALESVLWSLAKSAADLLISEEAQRVRQCESFVATGCTWLFLDATRNRSRRWCSMADCGNRAKARRHYQRAREDREPERGR